MAGPSQAPDAWRSWPPEEREREYSPSSCIDGNYLPFISAYKTRSQSALAYCQVQGARWTACQYGPKPAQRLLLCLPPALKNSGAGRPGLLVFIHGGYWQELSAQDSLFAAAGCVQHGHAFAAIDYTLAPAASVADIAHECEMAMAWLFRNAEELGLDATRIVVAGSSAGAHLAAMVAMGAQSGQGEEVPGRGQGVSAAVLVSGIYALEPLVGTSINIALGLDALSARQISPALLPLQGFAQALVCWGAIETQEFKRQSRDFAHALATAGAACDSFEIPQRNHFDVILDLTDDATLLGRKTLALLRGTL